MESSCVEASALVGWKLADVLVVEWSFAEWWVAVEVQDQALCWMNTQRALLMAVQWNQ